MGDIGVIGNTSQVGISDHGIALMLCTSVRNWRRYKDKFVTADMIEIKGKNLIYIVNYSKYQSEYSRQKGYRKEN